MSAIILTMGMISTVGLIGGGIFIFLKKNTKTQKNIVKTLFLVCIIITSALITGKVLIEPVLVNSEYNITYNNEIKNNNNTYEDFEKRYIDLLKQPPIMFILVLGIIICIWKKLIQ